MIIGLKYEDIYLKDYETVGELIAELREYFEYYNNERSRQSFDGRTPAEVYIGIPLKGAVCPGKQREPRGSLTP